MQTDGGTFAQARAQVREMAVEAFARHELTQEHRTGDTVRLWKCGRPGSSTYAFRVAAWPGVVVFTGDLGEAVLRMAERDPIPWVRGAVDSLDYLASKVQPQPERTFYAGDALAWAREVAGDDTLVGRGEFLDAVEQAFESGELAQDWHTLVDDAGLDIDAHVVGLKHSTAVLWMVEALRWFVQAHDARAADPTVRAVGEVTP